MAKKVLVVISHLGLGGGARKVASEVGSKLSERGYDVHFLTSYSHGSSQKGGAYLEDSTHKIKGELISLKKEKKEYPLHWSKTIFQTAKKISEICEEKKIDTVVSFLTLGGFSSVISKCFFGNEAKIIVSVRSNRRVKDKLRNILIKWLYPKADEVVVQTERIKEIMKKDFSLSNLSVIPNPIKIEKSQKAAKENIPEEHENIFNSKFIFIHVGRFTRAKGQWYLLRGFKKVIQKNPETNLVVLGDGELRKKLESLVIGLDLTDNVFLVGNMGNVFPYLRRSDCFVLSSLYEGFPNVVLEALSQNLPVVSTDCVSGPREILCPGISSLEEIKYPYFGKYGILTPSFEGEIFFQTLEEMPLTEKEEIFADAMIKVKEREEFRRKYLNGIDRAKDFTHDKVINQWEKIIH